MLSKNTNAFIGENYYDTNDRVKDGLALLKQLLNDDAEPERLILNRQTLSGIYWLLSNLDNALAFEMQRHNNEKKT